MGSTSSHLGWIVAAAICGLLYLIFDAARFFAQQLGPVRLRGLANLADENDKREGRWTRFDVDNFQLVSGSLLQIALIVAVVATVIAFDGRRPITTASLLASAIWLPVVILWKFVLALIPEEATELVLRGIIIPISHFFYFALWPILYPLRRLAARIDAEAQEDEEDEEPTDEEVQAYIDVGEEEGILEPAEGKLLQSIVDFGDRVAREIMTPRIDVLAFEANKSIDELARLFSESKYARIPIYRDSIDQIIGIVHIKDLFDAILRSEKKSVADLARPPYVVSETKSVSDLLREFQSEHIQVAVVVDEYGGTAGIVTLEDIVEEIVGEIADEHEEEEPTIVDVGDSSYLVSGLLRVETLQERLETDLRAGNYETIAGLIFTTLGRVPNAGAVVSMNGWRFIVDRADRKRIYRVKVERDPEWQAEGEEEI
jgi:CBS domain containing-hemolysin-like protein